MDERGDVAFLLERGIEAIGGKWKPKALVALAVRGTLRYGELREILNGVSDAVLSATLRDLCADGMAERTQYATMPPRVEYSLTDKGRGAIPVLKGLVAWAQAYPWSEDADATPLVKCDFHSPV